jgi:hypothetical protein
LLLINHLLTTVGAGTVLIKNILSINRRIFKCLLFGFKNNTVIGTGT